jgi:hypothetical protein
MALVLFHRQCQHYYESGQPRGRLQHAPVVVDDDLVGKLVSLRDVVRDEDGRLAPVLKGRHQLGPQVPAERGVQSRERLIEEQDRRVRREGSPESDTLLLAAGQFARVATRQAGEAQAA